MANHLSLLTDRLQIIIVDPNRNLDDTNEVISYLMNLNHENKSIYYISSKQDIDRYKLIVKNSSNFFAEINDELEIYICKDYSCNLPVTTLSELKKLFD